MTQLWTSLPGWFSMSLHKRIFTFILTHSELNLQQNLESEKGFDGFSLSLTRLSLGLNLDVLQFFCFVCLWLSEVWIQLFHCDLRLYFLGQVSSSQHERCVKEKVYLFLGLKKFNISKKESLKRRTKRWEGGTNSDDQWLIMGGARVISEWLWVGSELSVIDCRWALGYQ